MIETSNASGLEIGDRVAIRRGPTEVLGRIKGFGGLPNDEGVYPHIFVITPQGSVKEIGRAWVWPIRENPADLDRLKGIEDMLEVCYPGPTGGSLWPIKPSNKPSVT